MNADDDIDFPIDLHQSDDENLHLKENYPTEIKSTSDLQTESKFPLQLDIQPQKVIEDDLTPYDLKSLDKKVLISEMFDYDMYLKNIHKGFKSVTSVNSLIKLVVAGVGVHRHRRQVLNQIKSESKVKTLEFDEHGNLKS